MCLLPECDLRLSQGQPAAALTANAQSLASQCSVEIMGYSMQQAVARPACSSTELSGRQLLPTWQHQSCSSQHVPRSTLHSGATETRNGNGGQHVYMMTRTPLSIDALLSKVLLHQCDEHFVVHNVLQCHPVLKCCYSAAVAAWRLCCIVHR